MPTRNLFTERSELNTAVDLWMSDEPAAITTYGDINTWDVSAITDFSYLFSTTRNSSAVSFNSDIGNWDVSSGQNFFAMFYRAQIFNQNLGNWDVSN